MHAITRPAAAGLALAACLATAPLTAIPAAAHTGTPAATGNLSRFYEQRPHWTSCVLGPKDEVGRQLEQAGAQCADVTVPLDYSRPTGRTITVALSRIKATDTAHRVGPIVFNDGGPGGPSLASPVTALTSMQDTAQRYDLVGMDPRFVGRSTPLDCGWPVSTSLVSAGFTRASFDRQVAHQRDLARRCATRHGDVLPHVTTRNTARDMDVVRGVLRERKISYLGYSYGTYLGTAYTQMFPGRHDRVVLDGAINPLAYQPRMLKGQEATGERVLADWAAWAAQHNATYGLGNTREQVLRTVQRTTHAASQRPLVIGSGPDAYRVDDTTVPMVVFAGAASDRDPARHTLAGQLSLLARAARGEKVEPTPELARVLDFALTGVRSANGSAQTAILCGDEAAPRDPEVYWRDLEQIRAQYPLMGPMANNVNPCAFWPHAPREAPVRVQRDAAALIVAATGDPRTPYTGSKALRGMLPSSRLLTVEGANQHGLFGEYGNACVDARVNAYLRSGKLPAADLSCQK
ncbi:alpha/beta hydrolase [Streptomyces zagrosensis]|uniref:Pimeloyl-ACP methyl ester carboxylesterase n=1 Tax=Streptomyces zagrosensis TaxID=1042984 RepID=A0A7W9Q9W3_9ACTN|nr:alpha/beta hydrolase [Streptomyces zagrosensis]MBB5936323.1 pimeloyl-ACP methyl ester carboxylesterase [Streptomyces zagrosensis]